MRLIDREIQKSIVVDLMNSWNQIKPGGVWVFPSSTDLLFNRHDLSVERPVADAIRGIGMQQRHRYGRHKKVYR